jgi:hypothetical protein
VARAPPSQCLFPVQPLRRRSSARWLSLPEP